MGEEEREKKRMKCEPLTTAPQQQPTLKSTDSVDSFLLYYGAYMLVLPFHLTAIHQHTFGVNNQWLGPCRKEGLEMPRFKLLMVELDKRSLTTFGQLSQLTLGQWEEIMHAAELGRQWPGRRTISLASMLARHLRAPPSSSSTTDTPSQLAVRAPADAEFFEFFVDFAGLGKINSKLNKNK
jgi:hypothetical protein